MLHRNTLAALLGLPLVVAALVASTTYAWATLTVEPEPVEANGAALQDNKGTAMLTMKVSETEYLVVASYGNNRHIKAGDNMPAGPYQFVTVYELTKQNNKVDLRMVGMRCVEWDKGFDLVNFTAPEGWGPADLRKRKD